MRSAQSTIVQTGVRAATPLAILVGTYLLFAGHNQPGGGFAGGLVFGAVLALRTVAGIQRPIPAARLISAGIIVIVLTAASSLLINGSLLDQQIVSTELPVLGKVKVGSALPFDIGVTAVVIGLVIAVLDGLGARAIAVTQPTESPGGEAA